MKCHVADPLISVFLNPLSLIAAWQQCELVQGVSSTNTIQCSGLKFFCWLYIYRKVENSKYHDSHLKYFGVMTATMNHCNFMYEICIVGMLQTNLLMGR